MFKIDKEYDIVIIGAGPAGLTAARKASEGGAKTLIVEKEKRLGEKPCAEAVSFSTFETAEIKPSSNFIKQKINGAYIFAPNEDKKVVFSLKDIIGYSKEGGAIIDKPTFLEELASKTVKAGADFAICANAQDIRRNKDKIEILLSILGKKITISTKILIGCDGVNSIVAKKFFKRENYEVITCLQYRITNYENLENDKIYFYFGKEVAPLGYAWIFPKGENIANVGIGVRNANAKDYLDKFIENHKNFFSKSKIIEIGAAPVPISGMIEEIVSDNIMLCGDAAGQVIPVTGGGIHSSIAAGKIAGEIAAMSIEEKNYSKDFLKKYVEKYNIYWGERINKSLKVLRALEKLSDEELNMLADTLDGQDIVDLANGMNTTRVAMKLMKHPLFALKIAKAIL
ncbi:MAG: NAD(P)/FAD-dependent oxidoreductase [Nitrososphaerota archaeon]